MEAYRNAIIQEFAVFPPWIKNKTILCIGYMNEKYFLLRILLAKMCVKEQQF